MPTHIALKLEELITEWSVIKSSDTRAKVCEAEVLKIMEEQSMWKIRLENGEIYESKRLKDRIELRRGKL
jgi:hypothetical protein